MSIIHQVQGQQCDSPLKPLIQLVCCAIHVMVSSRTFRQVPKYVISVSDNTYLLSQNKCSVTFVELLRYIINLSLIIFRHYVNWVQIQITSSWPSQSRLHAVPLVINERFKIDTGSIKSFFVFLYTDACNFTSLTLSTVGEARI